MFDMHRPRYMLSFWYLVTATSPDKYVEMDTSVALNPHGCASCGFGCDGGIKRNPTSLSPLAEEFLRCNDPLPDSELAHIRGSIDDCTQRVSSLEENIARTRSTLERLSQEYDCVSQELAYLKTISSPIRKVPADIIAEIIVLACREKDPVEDVPPEIHSLDIRRMPWVIVRVCRSWRRLGNSLRAIWSTISIDFDHHRKPLRQSFLLALHVQLSGTNSLSVWLTAKSHHISLKHPYLPIILSSSSRWEIARAQAP